ncbi:hypothetical protein BC332_08624 [Capsicum chinense]|nr:hypothetical protein BC332_08624 [Capsicum chinense]
MFGGTILDMNWWRHTREISNLVNLNVLDMGNNNFTELRIATGGFSSENLIGSGSFGTVNKGTFTSDGMAVAVKVLNLQHQGASKSFTAECQALRNTRHRNLVKVISACSSSDFKGNDFKACLSVHAKWELGRMATSRNGDTEE